MAGGRLTKTGRVNGRSTAAARQRDSLNARRRPRSASGQFLPSEDGSSRSRSRSKSRSRTSRSRDLTFTDGVEAAYAAMGGARGVARDPSSDRRHDPAIRRLHSQVARSEARNALGQFVGRRNSRSKNAASRSKRSTASRSKAAAGSKKTTTRSRSKTSRSKRSSSSR